MTRSKTKQSSTENKNDTRLKHCNYSEQYKISQHDYTVIQMKVGEIKSMLYCNEEYVFIENELENLSKMLKNAITTQKQK